MKKENQKVKLSEKIGMLMVCAGNIPLMTLLSVYFMIYYTTVVGLDPKALATLFLISKVMDGISDPVMGFILDRFPVTKMGKFRPMLILGTIICVINYILLWFGAVWSPVGKYVIVYVTYSILLYTARLSLDGIPVGSVLFEWQISFWTQCHQSIIRLM